MAFLVFVYTSNGSRSEVDGRVNHGSISFTMTSRISERTALDWRMRNIPVVLMTSQNIPADAVVVLL
jgi:hypothetical protein